MEEVTVNLGRHSYRIVIGSGVIGRCGQYLEGFNLGKKVLLITNATVGDLYGDTVQSSLRDSGFKVIVHRLPDGEQYKTLQMAERLYDVAFTAGLDRACPVVALGGGVIGDLAGFTAATYMRGVPFVQIPTSLLAQVDSSVGGKVAVNHERGKNIIGSFYQPLIVLTDVDVLSSLPARELRAGLAEVIKYGIIKDAVFFGWLERYLENILRLDQDAAGKLVKQSCAIKAQIVEEDETEQGIRAILNFGHTLGHALETLTAYQKYRHGEAVAVGMVFASRLAEKMGMLKAEDRERIEALIMRAGLPAELPAGLSPKDFIPCFYSDKKVLSGRITFVLPGQIGRVTIARDLPEEVILQGFST